MGLHQTKKLLHSKANYQQNGKTTYWMRKDICKWYIWPGVNIQTTTDEELIHLNNNNNKTQTTQLKNRQRGLPWWRSGWESACQCRGHGFEPWSGRILHAAEQLGPWATIAEPACLEPVLRNERGRDSERPTHRDEEWPPLATTRESPHTETKTQHSHK